MSLKANIWLALAAVVALLAGGYEISRPVVGLTTCAIDGGSSASADTLCFPILTYRFDGDSTTTVTLNAPSGGTGTHLYIRSHGIKYNGKADVRVNGGDWVDLDMGAAGVECLTGEERYNGCLTIFPVVRFKVSDGSWTFVNGNNTIEFRTTIEPSLNGAKIGADPGHGWRALDLDIFNSGETRLGSYVRYDMGPGDWTIANSVGAAWDNQDSINAGLQYMTDPVLGLNASCADCHSEQDSASDLTLFNFEPLALKAAAESRFGAGAYQIESIVAAVISRDLTGYDWWPSGVDQDTVGRPWSILYQPCEGTDSEPSLLWATGSAHNNYRLDCVLDHDSLMVDWQNESFNALQYVNPRELETSFMHTDVHNWLPRCHPLDCFENFAGSVGEQAYDAFISSVEGTNRNALVSDANGFWKDTDDWGVCSADQATFPDGVVAASADLWRLKTQFFNGHIRNPEIFSTGWSVKYGTDATQYEWAGILDRTVFDVAPHISPWGGGGKCLNGQDGYEFHSSDGDGPYDPEGQQNHYNDVWPYNLSRIIQGGHRQEPGLKPVDWKYQAGHLGGYQARGGSSAELQNGWNQIASMQQLINIVNISGELHERHMNPAWVLKVKPLTGEVTGAGSALMGPYNRGEDDVFVAMMENVLRPHIETMYNLSMWSAGGRTGVDFDHSAEGYTPDTSNIGTKDDEITDSFVSLISLCGREGCSPTLMDSAATLIGPGYYNWNYDATWLTELGSGPPTAAPTLVEPTDTDTGVPADPSFDWGDVALAGDYDLDIDKVNTFDSGDLRQITEATSDHDVVDRLDYSTLYYWRARGANSFGDGPWSSTWSFTTEADPATWDEHEFGDGSACDGTSQVGQQWRITSRSGNSLLRNRGAVEGCFRSIDMSVGDTIIVDIDSVTTSSGNRQQTVGLFLQDNPLDAGEFISWAFTGAGSIKRLRVVRRADVDDPAEWQETTTFTNSINNWQLRAIRSTTTTFTLWYKSPSGSWTQAGSSYTLPTAVGVTAGGTYVTSGSEADSTTFYYTFTPD